MYYKITIEKVSVDRLYRRAWDFCLVDEKLVLDGYFEQSRPTARHKFQNHNVYSRLSGRNNTLNLDAVPWDAGLEKEAMQKLMETLASSIRVVKQYN
jgi:hypothetical protein